MNKLTKRLTLISDLIEEKIIADVGCDHGKLTRFLFDEGKIDFAYISDISEPSLKKAIDILSPYQGRFSSICCDGLKGYESSVQIDECVIAGMGGFEIKKIIENSPISINKYILAPQHDEIELKKYLIENNYKIVFDIIILDKGKFYNIIKCVKCDKKTQISDFNLYFGKDNFTSKLSDLSEFVDKKLEKLLEIRSQQKVKSLELDQKICFFEKAKKELKENE